MRFIWFAFFLSCSLSAQQFSSLTLDKLEDEALLSLFNEVEYDSIKAEKVARVYLNRARKENDTIKMARGYDRLARIFHSKKKIQFADSIIFLTKNIKNITYPGLGYIIKGYEYERIGNLKLTTQNFMLNYNISLKNKNIQQQLFSSNQLVFLNSIWGNKKEALEIQKKRHKIILSKNYLNEVKKSTRKNLQNKINDLMIADKLASYENFAFCYLNLRYLDSANLYVKKGVELNKEYEGDKLRKEHFRLFFKEIKIEIDYYSGEYKQVIKKSNDILPKLLFNKDITSIQNIYLFKGLSLLKINKTEKGIEYLKKSDSIFNEYELVLKQPYQRVLFKELLNYYRLKGNLNERLHYLNKLLYVDSIIKRNYQFFEPTFIKEFENPKLFKEKEQLIMDLKSKNMTSKSIIWMVLGFLIICLLVIYFYYKKQKAYKARFKALMVKNNTVNSNGLKLSANIYKDILNKLELFEQNKGYLKNNITLYKLSKDFNTNQKYLSRVINIETENNFSQYLNDLRITFAFEALQINEKLRSFTIKAIAKESGFKNAESFSKAFYKKYKIQPSFYLKQLNRREELSK